MAFDSITANYPGSLLAETDLGLLDNRQSFTLAADITSGATTLTVSEDISNAPTTGVLTIENERILYTGTSGTDTFTGLTRGYDGSNAAAHSSGAVVDMNLVAAHLNRLTKELIATQTELGATSSQSFVRTDGTEPLTTDWDAGANQIRAETFHADVTTGTAPFTVDSTTVVPNLNADQVDGKDSTDFLLLDGSQVMTGALDMGGNGITDAGTVQADTFEVINAGAGANPTLTSNSASQTMTLTANLDTTGAITENGNPVPNDTDTLDFFSATTSAQLASVITDETGTGSLLFGASPTIAQPTLTTDFTLQQTTADYTIQWNDPAAARTYTIPDTGGADTFLFESRTLTGGDGISTIGDLSADRTISVDLATSPGLKFTGGQLTVEPADFAGSGLEDDGSDNLRIAAAAAGDGLKGGGGSALAVEPADFAGAGLEDDGSDNLRIASTAAGNGLTGGGGAALAIATNGVGTDELDESINPTWTGDHDFDGTVTKVVSSVTGTGGTTTISNSDFTVLVDTSSNTETINLPASPATGQTHTIRRDGASNDVTIDGNGNNIQEGTSAASTFTLDTDAQRVTLLYDGTVWRGVD